MSKGHASSRRTNPRKSLTLDTARKPRNPTGKGLIPGQHKRDDSPMVPSVWDGTGGKALSLVQKRARAGFIARMNLYEEIVDGKLEQRVRTITADGKETVTIYTPSVKDRMGALDKLAQYGQVPTGDKQGGGGGTDLPTLIRALGAVMSDPVTRRNLMADERIAGTLSLFAAQEIVIEDEGTASGMPGDDEGNPDVARDAASEGP